MAKFCGNCGEQLNDNAVFCGKCGAKVAVADFTYQQPAGFSNNINTSANRTHWVLSFLGQILCAILFFLPTVNFEALWVTKDVSLLKQMSEDGYSAVYVIALILYFAAALVMILPVIQNKPLKANNLVFMQIMSVLFFVFNVIMYFLIDSIVKDEGYGIVECSLNAWGWIYIIVSVLIIIDLMVLSSNVKKTTSI